MFKGKTSLQAVRINRLKTLPATVNIEHHAARLSRLSTLARGGGILLAGVGGYVGCQQIAATHNRQEKNEILVETVFSAVLGSAAGIAVTFALATNPVGWGLALILSTGASAAGYASGKGMRYLYDKQGQEIDLVSHLGVDSLCK